MSTTTTTPVSEHTRLGVWYVVAGLLGLVFASALVLEKLSYWVQKAGGHVPGLSCDLNPIVGCGSVVNTAPASIFWGLPNPVIGVAAWPVVVFFGVLLVARVRLPEWMWAGLQVGAAAALVMVSYLQIESIYVLHHLCPWCMATWVVVIPTFWLTLSRNLRGWAGSGIIARAFSEWTAAWILLHYVLLFCLIFMEFGTKLWA